jgi:hypothetical protein
MHFRDRNTKKIDVEVAGQAHTRTCNFLFNIGSGKYLVFVRIGKQPRHLYPIPLR